MDSKKSLKQKRIFLLDCEYFYKTSLIPNYKVMKLSSYHKQLGDLVVLISAESQLTNDFDIMYLIRELRNTPFPSGDYLDDYRTVLIGKQFEMFEEVQELQTDAAMCRPDYTIYTYQKQSIYTKSNYVQFFNGNVRLKNSQDWHRFDSKGTIIVDPNFWDFPASVVTECLKSIRYENNIIFLNPIKLKKLTDLEVLESFSKLKLAKSAKMRYYNNIGEDYNSAVTIIDVMANLKSKVPYLNINSIPFKIVTTDHWSSKENIYNDFERCLKIMAYAQTKKVRINLKYPNMRLSSPSWYIFEFFKTWSNHLNTYSYVDAILKGAQDHYHQSYYVILNDEKYWRTAKIKQIIHLLVNYPELIDNYGFIGWGGITSTSKDKINYGYVREKAIENHIL